MGYYINPPTGSKEDWLVKNAKSVTPAEARDFYKDCDHPPAVVLLVLVNNGAFTACGVAYSPGEAAAFQRPEDPRPKLFYAALLKDLNEGAGLAPDFPETFKKLWYQESGR